MEPIRDTVPVPGRIIGDIEVLRAIAVLVTVFQHQALVTQHRISRIDPYFDFWYGVDIFFVISGFVIVRSLLPGLSLANTRAQYWRYIVAFWMRRIWRIWPTAWLWLSFVVVMSIITGSGTWGEPMRNLQDAAAILLHMQNLHRVDPDAFQGSAILSIYWSLSLEEQFYLLLPLVLFAVPAKWLLRVLVGIVVMQLFMTRWPLNSNLSGVLWSIRSDGLILGVIIAYSFSSKWIRDLLEPTFLTQSSVVRFCNIALPLFLMSALTARHVVWFGTGAVALLSAWLVWVASYDKSYLIADGPIKRVLLWVGSRSYGIYLIHIPSMLLAHEIWAHLGTAQEKLDKASYSTVVGLTALALVVVLSEANYRFVEVRLRNKGAAIAKRISQGSR